MRWGRGGWGGLNLEVWELGAGSALPVSIVGLGEGGVRDFCTVVQAVAGDQALGPEDAPWCHCMWTDSLHDAKTS